jgi:3-hydroxyisobutyrate dehydrogenase-like beta-hydroxyacid dehydrogenase
MGAPIAGRLEQAGHELSVWNRSAEAMDPCRERGIRCLDRASDAWQHADLVITMLADDAAVDAVTSPDGGVLTASASGTLVDMSTISAPTSAQGGGALRNPRGRVLAGACERQPLRGGGRQSGDHRLRARNAFDRLADTLQDIGRNLFYVGGGEEARIVKLALNLMIGGTVQLMAEALSSPTTTAPPSRSAWGTRICGLALEAGADVEAPLPLTAITQQPARPASRTAWAISTSVPCSRGCA